ncbi:hypothetical protein [Ponticaulis sp.]|uniref:hypothetical protein n=1 Tax=Ponticaulis sp. TaxID=2020902 RepID=UPI0026383CE6|nr:hypothetical protein [Ponticaulis sp.]MDF1679127.1 hypothetical protein [Ponticaulis sp.]
MFKGSKIVWVIIFTGIFYYGANFALGGFIGDETIQRVVSGVIALGIGAIMLFSKGGASSDGTSRTERDSDFDGFDGGMGD